MGKKREVKITQAMSKDYDEWWVEEFICPNCGGIIIDTGHTNYCHCCGYKIKWDIEEK
jgi:hypothetical protein